MRTLAIFLGLFCVLEGFTKAEFELEKFTYSEDFESRELNAWASYPVWNDAAYDPNFRVYEIVPGDPNISIEQKVTPYSCEDAYCGAQKLLDMYFATDSTLSLRYFLKTNQHVEFIKVLLAAGPDGKLEYTVNNPTVNRWEQITVTFPLLAAQNPRIAGREQVKVNAVAVLAKVPKADPAMPIYFGLDDVVFHGRRVTSFRFEEPDVVNLPEWKPYIFKKPFFKGDAFTFKGSWNLDADTVNLTITPFGRHEERLLTANLKRSGKTWSLNPFPISWKENMYRGVLTAFNGTEIIAETEFLFHVAPKAFGVRHPRLHFNIEGKSNLLERFTSGRYGKVRENIENNAIHYRAQTPVDAIFYDYDQLVDDPCCNTWGGWGIGTGETPLFYNTLAYALFGDREAGDYAKGILLAYLFFPTWNHPYYERRGQYSSLSYGFLSPKIALAYDLLYDLLSEQERKFVREGMLRLMIKPTHETYAVDNMVTCNTSNWLPLVVGGSLSCIVSIYGDGVEDENIEVYLAGALLKMNEYLEKSCHSDGSYAEGFDYYSHATWGMSEGLPALNNVFSIDISERVRHSYQEFMWGSVIPKGWYFFYGDRGADLPAFTCDHLAWLLGKYRDPLLGWFYSTLRALRYKNSPEPLTYFDVLYDTDNAPSMPPYDQNPSRVFPEEGRTIFKSGWGEDDFAFSMQSGPFFNHCHFDQGSFWIADRGTRFTRDMIGADYYGDPIYDSYQTQPIAHSTILINHNPQSQRAGDPYRFAEGFDDYAFIYHYLEGGHAAFSSADIGRVYWGKVKELRRNVLYLKPRAILMIDTIVPAGEDVDVTLLFQTRYLEDIRAGEDVSRITIDGSVLHINHLYPQHKEVKSVERPHFIFTYDRKPLIPEGMLSLTARTRQQPLIIANLLMSTTGDKPDITTSEGDGFFSGYCTGILFAFSTRLDAVYEYAGITTDALAVIYTDSTVFAALCTTLKKDGVVLVESSEPVTCEVISGGVELYRAEEGGVTIGVAAKPREIIVNGEPTKAFLYNPRKRTVELVLPKGETSVLVR